MAANNNRHGRPWAVQIEVAYGALTNCVTNDFVHGLAGVTQALIPWPESCGRRYQTQLHSQPEDGVSLSCLLSHFINILTHVCRFVKDTFHKLASSLADHRDNEVVRAR
jgi:hypothetical protein